MSGPETIENGEGEIPTPSGVPLKEVEFLLKHFEPQLIELQVKICAICNQNESKYKCTRCDLRYCSVPCATLHTQNHPPVEEAPKPDPAPEAAPPVSNGAALAGTVGGARAISTFEKLGASKELEILFTQYPRLKSQLRDIYAFTNPPTEFGMGMNQYAPQPQNQYGHDDSRGGRGRGGRGGYSGRQNGKPKGPWTTDQGMQDAIDAFGRAKEEYGKGGEGIREYQNLVMKMVRADGEDVSQIVQAEIAEENSRLISALLNAEQY